MERPFDIKEQPIELMIGPFELGEDTIALRRLEERLGEGLKEKIERSFFFSEAKPRAELTAIDRLEIAKASKPKEAKLPNKLLREPEAIHGDLSRALALFAFVFDDAEPALMPSDRKAPRPRKTKHERRREAFFTERVADRAEEGALIGEEPIEPRGIEKERPLTLWIELDPR